MNAVHSQPRVAKLLEIEFRRSPGWLLIVVPAVALGANAYSGTPYAPQQLVAKIQAILGPGMGAHHIFAGVALLVLIPILRSARVRATELGLGRGTLGPALLVTFALWLVAVVLIELLSNAWAENRPGLHRQWTEMGAVAMGGILLGFLLSAAIEEVVFRGVLFPQVYVRLANRVARRWVAVVLAVLLTQGGFALLHIPARLQGGHYDRFWVILGDQVGLLVGGCVGILVLVTTRNLSLMIGFHTLYNAPVPLFAPPPDTPRLGSRLSVFVFGLIAIAAWTWYVRRRTAPNRALTTPPVVVTVEEATVGGG